MSIEIRNAAKQLSISIIIGFVVVFGIGGPFPFALIWYCPGFVSEPLMNLLLWPDPFFERFFPSQGTTYSSQGIASMLAIDAIVLSCMIFLVGLLCQRRKCKPKY